MMAIREPHSQHNALHSSFRQSRSIDVPQLIHIVFGCAEADAIATIRYARPWRPAHPAALDAGRVSRGPVRHVRPRTPVPAAARPARRIIRQRGTAECRTVGEYVARARGTDGTDGGERRRNRAHTNRCGRSPRRRFGRRDRGPAVESRLLVLPPPRGHRLHGPDEDRDPHISRNTRPCLCSTAYGTPWLHLRAGYESDAERRPHSTVRT